MKQLTYVFLVMVGVLIAADARSQLPLRLEIPVRQGTNPVSYMAAGEEGVCLFYPTRNDSGKDSISWSFVMMDRNLKELWRKQIPMHEDVTYLKGIYQNNVIYLLFHDTQRNTEGNIFVFFIYPAKQIITQHRSAIPQKAEVADFGIFNEFALIGFNQRKGRPGVLGFSLVTGEKRNFEIPGKEDALLLGVTADTLYSNIYAVYKTQSGSSRNALLVNVYNSSSTLRRTISFSNQQEKKIINSAQFIPTADGKGFVAGSYGYGNKNHRNYDYYNDYYNYYYYDSYYRRQLNYDANQDNTPISDGYYTASISDSSGGTMQYFNFINFANAFKYLNDPEALRSKRKADKASKKEQADGTVDKEYSLNFRLLMHPLTLANGKFVLMAEAYNPEYHTMTQMVYDYYGRAIPSTYSVFDGFRYTNAFIAGFDSSGNMAWSNGMEMRDILTTYLNKRMNLHPDNGELILFYNANGKLAYKTIQGATVVENTSLTPISPKRQTDQLVSEYMSSAEFWYGDYFLASGYSSLRNNYLDENKRNVFYLTKLAFR